jgi:5-methylcytosine-specific restriction endonuclease McrA
VTEIEIKKAVRARDNYACTNCGMTDQQHKATFGRSLEVHRVAPGSPYTVNGCVTLCKPCHGPQPKSPHGSPSSRTFKLPEEHNRRLRQLARRNRRFLGTELAIAVEEYLAKNGLWPPPPAP